jgi:hypothetical protein
VRNISSWAREWTEAADKAKPIAKTGERNPERIQPAYAVFIIGQ